MTPLARLAFRRVRSFRREDGGLYAAWCAVYSRAYAARQRRVHARGGHGRLMGNGRCEWCGITAGPSTIPEPDSEEG